MNKNSKARLVLLNTKLTKTVELASRDEDKESHVGRNIAIGAGIAGAGYAGASLYRGRKWQANTLGGVQNTRAGLLGALKTGHQANVADASKGIAKASTAVKGAAGVVADKAVAAGRSSKAALLIAQRKGRALLKR